MNFLKNCVKENEAKLEKKKITEERKARKEARKREESKKVWKD